MLLLAPRLPKSKRQKIQEDLEDYFDDGQIVPDEIKIPEKPRYQKGSRNYVYSMPQFGKDCVTVTDTEGRRVFLPISEALDEV